MKLKIMLITIIPLLLTSHISWARNTVIKSDSSCIDYHLYTYLNIGKAKSLDPNEWTEKNIINEYSRSSSAAFGYGVNCDVFLKFLGVGLDFYNNHIHANDLFDYFFSSTIYHINYKDINASLFYRYSFNFDDANCFLRFGLGPDYVLYRISCSYDDDEFGTHNFKTDFKNNSSGYHFNADFCVDYGYFSTFIGFNYLHSKLGNLKDDSDNSYLLDRNNKKIDVTLTAKTIRFGIGINI